MDNRRERGIRLLDAITACINEHPIVGQWITEILDRKTEPSDSEKSNNCEICRHYTLACDLFSEICRYEPKTEPQGYCNECKWYGDKQVCGRCRSKNMYAPKDESQTDVVALDKATLMDYFINSVNENDEPVWTERHIDEILKDFDVVPKTKPQMEELQFAKQCHKPLSSYYRCYCDERKNDEYCNGCEFWYEPQKDNMKAIKDLQEYYGIKQEPMLSEMV